MNLLVECARARSDAARIRQAASAVADWDVTIELSISHNIAPLVYWCVNQACPEIVPPAALDRLRTCFRDNAGHSLQLTGELLRLLSLFDRAGIEVVPYKGPAIAWSLYETPALREMGDLDLLVRPADAPRAIDLLVGSGCQPEYSTDLRFLRSARELHVTSPAGVNLDLHWALAPSHFCHALDLDHFWSRLVTISIAGRPIRTLAPEDLLVFLCVHGAKHFWSSLHWLCDLARLIDRAPLDWDSLMAYSRARRISRTVSAGLVLAADVLGAAVPPAILAGARACPCASRIASRAQLWLHGRPVPPVTMPFEFRFQHSLLERRSDKFRHYWSLIAPAPVDVESLTLPRSLFPVYHVLRPVRLMAKYSGLAARRLLS
jgi:hypothetical protein